MVDVSPCAKCESSQDSAAIPWGLSSAMKMGDISASAFTFRPGHGNLNAEAAPPELTSGKLEMHGVLVLSPCRAKPQLLRRWGSGLWPRVVTCGVCLF